MNTLSRPLAAAGFALILAAHGAHAQTAPAPGNPAVANPPPSGAAQMKPDRPAASPPTPAAAAAADKIDKSPDLIRDRPRTLDKMWAMTMAAAAWTAGVTMDAVDQIMPPSASDFTAENDSTHLFKLLGYAGYKLKEIDNEVGLIPGLAFKFGLVREVSEADLDYLDEQMDYHRFANPGLLSELQRGIVSSVVAINTGGGMQVSELKLRLLPLPKAQFSITPSEGALSEEGSALMRAIQRVDRRVRDIARTELKAAAPEARR